VHSSSVRHHASASNAITASKDAAAAFVDDKKGDGVNLHKRRIKGGQDKVPAKY
jgi:hypothetical protein